MLNEKGESRGMVACVFWTGCNAYKNTKRRRKHCHFVYMRGDACMSVTGLCPSVTDLPFCQVPSTVCLLCFVFGRYPVRGFSISLQMNGTMIRLNRYRPLPFKFCPYLNPPEWKRRFIFQYIYDVYIVTCGPFPGNDLANTLPQRDCSLETNWLRYTVSMDMKTESCKHAETRPLLRN
jgi:hypothetical protein